MSQGRRVGGKAAGKGSKSRDRATHWGPNRPFSEGNESLATARLPRPSGDKAQFSSSVQCRLETVFLFSNFLSHYYNIS